MWGPTQNLGRIDLAVLTFIGYKQTDKPNLYIDFTGVSWKNQTIWAPIHQTKLFLSNTLICAFIECFV